MAKPPTNKHPIINFRAHSSVGQRLKGHAVRVGLSQGELIRRFVEQLPSRASYRTLKKQGKAEVIIVTVDVGPKRKRAA